MIPRSELIEVMARAIARVTIITEKPPAEWFMKKCRLEAEAALNALLAALPDPDGDIYIADHYYLDLLEMKQPPHPDTKEP